MDRRPARDLGVGRKLLNKIFPDHWSFLIGEIALYSFIVLARDGRLPHALLRPLEQGHRLRGLVRAARGQHVSEAFASTVNLSFAVRGGLLMRQMHHWAANIFVGSIVVHMLRIFFTGAFRRPRELNWLIGSTLLILAIFNGFLGYSLPDDLVSGTGIRIAFSIVESIPLIGSYTGLFPLRRQFPGDSIIPRFFILHVLILPAIIALLIGAHLGLLVRQKHTQFPGRGHKPRNVVGVPMWPTFIAKTTGFLFLTTGVTGLLSALFQINPIWLYGQYVPYKVSYAVQPDWYMGWLDGALRIMPSWEIVVFGHMIPNAFFPAILLPGITFGVLQMWPFIEAKLTKDTAEHQILDRPRDRPLRTAFGAAVFAFYFVLFGASATDVLANYLSISLNVVLDVVPGPCVRGAGHRVPGHLPDLQGAAGGPDAGKRKRANVVLRSADGGYSTILSEERPGDEGLAEADPFPLDEGIELVPAMANVLATGDGLEEEALADAGRTGWRAPLLGAESSGSRGLPLSLGLSRRGRRSASISAH